MSLRKGAKLTTAFAAYTVSKSIGEGGAGTVYEVVDDDDGRILAAKVLNLAKATRDKLKRFENEIRFSSRNLHANIIKVVGYGTTDDKEPFFVMPRYASSLRAAIATIDPNAALDVFRRVLDGVEAAHLQGIVHRDIKPENVLVADELADVVVADFGIARFSDDELYTAVETRHEARLANFQYAAPEQRARGRAVDERADIYALGLLLNELFTKELALGKDHKSIGSVHAVSAYLDPIVDNMLKQDPNARYRTIAALKSDIIAQGQTWVTLQRLSALKQTVISTGEIDDPLITDPPQLESVDWKDGVLTIGLHQILNREWVWAFRHMGNHSAVYGVGPERFSVLNNEVTVPVSAHDAERALEHFKQWLPNINRVYAERIAQLHRERERDERAKLEEQVRRERERLAVLEKLRVT